MMNYREMALQVLRKLGIRKMYKGCEYIITSVDFIYHNKNFTPITKILYVEIAKRFKTSTFCVENCIRSVIGLIWNRKENAELLTHIFGEYDVENRPSNTEFLMMLYDYIKINIDYASSLDEELVFMCPLSGNKCEFCRDFVIEVIGRMHCK